MTIFHDPDDGWIYADEAEIPVSRWLFNMKCSYVWTGASWERWIGPSNARPSVIYSESQWSTMKWLVTRDAC